MCQRKPKPRCYGHAQADLKKFEGKHAELAEMDDLTLRNAHARAVAEGQSTIARTMHRLLDLRLDRDATNDGVKRLETHLQESPRDGNAWYRYFAAKACMQAKNEYGVAHDEVVGADPRFDVDVKTLCERRERLARTEGRAAAMLAVRGELTSREILSLSREYEATLVGDAHVRTLLTGGRPARSASARDRITYKHAVDGAREGVPGQLEAAEGLATATHRAEAVSTWGYAHEMPRSGHRDARTGAITALDGVRIAVMTRTPVRYEAGQVTVATSDNSARQRLWRAGYQVATPVGPVIVREGNAVTSAAA